jgi:hypothetical protein
MSGFLGLAMGLAGLGAGLALANLFSVSLPYPVEKRSGSPTPRPTTGHTGEAFGGFMLTLLGVGVAVTPVIAAVILTQSAPAAIRLPVLVPCAAAYGLALAWAGVWGAATIAEQKLPELAQVAIQSTI